MTTQCGGAGLVAQSPHCRRNYVSIERMSCCAGVSAPQSHNLWPLTPAEVCIYWNIDPLCYGSLKSCRIHNQHFEWGKHVWIKKENKGCPSLWINHLTSVSISISAEDFRRRLVSVDEDNIVSCEIRAARAGRTSLSLNNSPILRCRKIAQEWKQLQVQTQRCDETVVTISPDPI